MLPPFELPELTKESAAIAFSGGGDSTAMVHAFRDNPSVTHAFIIDHNLRVGSAAEVAQAAEFAKSLGYTVVTNRWEHDGVTSAIQVKAREYRYHALGKLCRAAGLKHLITAHTADDQAETILMRLDRQTGWRGLAGMPVSAGAPLWPALAGVMLHRPWLDVSRTALREYNRSYSLSFVDDPSNENRDFTRIRARQALSADQDLRSDLLAQQAVARIRLAEERRVDADWLSRHATFSLHGYVRTRVVPPRELLLHLLNGVAGRGGPIDATKRARLCAEMNQTDFKASTLAGAWVIRHDDGFVFTRDMVAVTGRRGTKGLSAIDLKAGETTLWDGRFWITAKEAGLRVIPAFGHLAEFRQLFDFKHLFEIPAEARASLPVFWKGSSPIGYGTLESQYIISKAATASRLQAHYPEAVSVSV